jgi:spoIIIJ-associated protein
MKEYQEFTGKSVEEALKSAREAFGVSDLRDIDFEILTQGSRGVLGMGAEPARIIAAPRVAGSAPPTRPTPAPAPTPAQAAAPAPAESARPAEPATRVEPAPSPGPSPTQAPATPTVSEAAPTPVPSADRPPRQGGRGAQRGGRGDRTARPAEARQTSDQEARQVAAERSRADHEDVAATEASPAALEAGREILEQLVGLMGYRAEVTVAPGATARIVVHGADESEREALGALIGRKGERLSALQHLVNLMLSRRMGEWTRVLVDVEDYRGRRERQLVEVARRAAERVLSTGTMLQLEPMSALERRWIHIALRDVDGVATQSIGEEPQRRVVVIKT